VRYSLLLGLILQDKGVIDVWQFISSFVRLILEAHQNEIADLFGYPIAEFRHPIGRSRYYTVGYFLVSGSLKWKFTMEQGVQNNAHVP